MIILKIFITFLLLFYFILDGFLGCFFVDYNILFFSIVLIIDVVFIFFYLNRLVKNKENRKFIDKFLFIAIIKFGIEKFFLYNIIYYVHGGGFYSFILYLSEIIQK
jgi:hypothetical protein